MVWISAVIWPRPLQIARLRGGAGAGRFQHSEWAALLSRFAGDAGVDYQNFARVRRLVEVYLSRLAEIDPETFADADDQLAFYLNAYNAVAVHQVLQHYPVDSIRLIPGAFTRPYAIGRRNVALHGLHAHILRAFGDPRIHVAICPTARSAPQLQLFTGPGLQRELDVALQTFLADPLRGCRFDEATNTLYLSSIFRWFGGDFVQPHAMPNWTQFSWNWLQPELIVHVLQPYFPATITSMLQTRSWTLRWQPFNWQLNDVLPL
jgi:hypothetical protein